MKSIHGRRTVLKQGAALGAAVALGPVGLGSARAQADELAPYKAAKVNWKQVEGETITVMVIPASYFENLISLQPQFEALTGIKLRYVPHGAARALRSARSHMVGAVVPSFDYALYARTTSAMQAVLDLSLIHI